MDWTQILTVFGASILGCGGISGLIVWYFQHSLQKRANIELEKFKAIESRISSQLNTKFSIWHKARVKAMIDVYGSLADGLAYYKPCIKAGKDIFPTHAQTPDVMYTSLADKMNNMLNTYLKNTLFFDHDAIEKIKSIINIYKEILISIDTCVLSETQKKECESELNKAESLINALRLDFRKIIEDIN